MRRLVALTLLLAACDEELPNPPGEESCREFDHVTVRRGRALNCRMLWCESWSMSTSASLRETGTMSTLWCDDAVGDAGVRP